MFKRLHFILVAASIGLIVSCDSSDLSETETKELAKVEFLLDWQAEPSYLGIYYAKQLGLYSNFGYDVDVVQSWGANQAVSAIATGKYLIGTASGGATVLGYNNTSNVVSLGVLYPAVPSVIYSLIENPLSEPTDIYGKRIGIYPSSSTKNEFFDVDTVFDRAGNNLSIDGGAFDVFLA